MNGQFLDLTEEEIDQIQEILEFEYDEGSSDEDERTYEQNNADFGANTMDGMNSTLNRDELLEHESMENNNDELIVGEHAVNDMNGEISQQTDSNQNTVVANSGEENPNGNEDTFLGFTMKPIIYTSQ